MQRLPPARMLAATTYHQRAWLHCTAAPPSLQYDGDQSGCVTHSEFIMMLRDLEALPEHYAPEDDPEFKAQRAARKK